MGASAFAHTSGTDRSRQQHDGELAELACQASRPIRPAGRPANQAIHREPDTVGLAGCNSSLAAGAVCSPRCITLAGGVLRAQSWYLLVLKVAAAASDWRQWGNFLPHAHSLQSRRRDRCSLQSRLVGGGGTRAAPPPACESQRDGSRVSSRLCLNLCSV